MHPEILRELTAQRQRDMHAVAHEAKLARMMRAVRRGAQARHRADEIAIPAIPDYVDGSFRTTPAGDQAASQPGQVTASHRAA
jgi:hypothetical protein